MAQRAFDVSLRNVFETLHVNAVERALCRFNAAPFDARALHHARAQKMAARGVRVRVEWRDVAAARR
eukprot:2899052-Lingulodinium_polyedra.AAC.1